MENPKELVWFAPDNYHLPKRQEFLIAISIIGLAIVFFAILTRNYLLVILVAISAVFLYASLKRKPGLTSFKLNEDGLFINQKFYTYSDFASFWIFDSTNIHELALRPKKHFLPFLIIPLYNIGSDKIAEFLSNHLDPQEEKESLVDLIRKNYF